MSMTKSFCIVFLAACLCGSFAFAQEVVKDSYIILFQQNAGVIDPPNPANAGKVPMGQPTSGQNKEQLEVELGLNGKIVFILEVSNGIVVKMNEQEAQQWRNDVRVMSVEQDFLLSSFDAIQDVQGDFPLYRDNKLTIPRVDTDQQAGIFQGGVFQYDSAINAWRLQDYRVAPVADIFLLDSNAVELIVKETLPTQVFLKVKGSFSDSCQTLGRVNHRLKGNRFEVVISVASSGSQACFPEVKPFEKIIPLPVYGLPVGNYEYIVNGKITGSFELKSDNNL